MTTRVRSVSSSSYSSYTSETDSEDERYYAGARGYNTGAYDNTGAYIQQGHLPTQVVGAGQTYTTTSTNYVPTQTYETTTVLPTQVVGTGIVQAGVNEVTTANFDINHSQKPLVGATLPATSYQTVESYSKGPSVLHPHTQTTATVVTTESVGARTLPVVQAENVALAQAGPVEVLKGRGSRLRNKIRLRRNKNKGVGAIDPVTGLTMGVGAMELVDRSKFNGYGPVDQLDQKLAGRNAIDNAIAVTKGNPDYNVGGYPAMESYRQNPENIMRHKFTGQTHFDTENASTGPGFTNGDFYDKPGYAGTKYGQARHQGPIDALAQKIVGHHYTTHEPMMDKIYVEPHQKGPIDTLAHMLSGGHHNHAVIADGVGTTGLATGVPVNQSAMQRITGRLHRHHRSKKAGVVSGDPYYRNTGTILPKEMGEGPIDALGHKLTMSFHDPLHTKTAGLGLHNEIVPAGVVNAGVGAGPIGTTTTTVVTEEHVGLMQKLKNKMHH